MVKQQFMTEKLLADRKLKKKGITSKGLGVPKAKKDLHGPIKVGDVCVLHVGHQTGGLAAAPRCRPAARRPLAAAGWLTASGSAAGGPGHVASLSMP